MKPYARRILQVTSDGASRFARSHGFVYSAAIAFNLLLLSGIAEAALVGILFTAAVLSYRYLSPRRVRLVNAMTGSLAFLLLLFAIRAGFTFYVKKISRLNVIYGSLFSIVCFIIVAYLFAAAYLFCASIIGVLEREEGKEDFPEREQGAGTDEASGSN